MEEEAAFPVLNCSLHESISDELWTLIMVSTKLEVQSILKRTLIKSKYGEPGKRRENILPAGCVVLRLLYGVLAFNPMRWTARRAIYDEKNRARFVNFSRASSGLTGLIYPSRSLASVFIIRWVHLIEIETPGVSVAAFYPRGSRSTDVTVTFFTHHPSFTSFFPRRYVRLGLMDHSSLARNPVKGHMTKNRK